MLQQRGIWEDDLTREFVMKQEEEFQKQAKETVQKTVEGRKRTVIFIPPENQCPQLKKFKTGCQHLHSKMI